VLLRNQDEWIARSARGHATEEPSPETGIIAAMRTQNRTQQLLHQILVNCPI
jgi:hypothetical protein